MFTVPEYNSIHCMQKISYLKTKILDVNQNKIKDELFQVFRKELQNYSDTVFAFDSFSH